MGAMGATGAMGDAFDDDSFHDGMKTGIESRTKYLFIE